MHYLRFLRIARSAEGGGGGGGSTPPAVVVPPAPVTPVAAAIEFSPDFIKQVIADRDALKATVAASEKAASEAKAATEKAANEARAASEKAVKDGEAAVSKTVEALNARIVRAEVKATAIAAGLAHLDFLKLVDTSEVKVDADGEVSIPTDFWSKVKASMPHLFATTGAAAGATGSSATPPKPAPAGGKRAEEMTDDEFDAAVASLGRR